MINQNYRNHIGMYRLQQVLKLIQHLLSLGFIACLFFLPFLNYTTENDGTDYELKFSIFEELKLTFIKLKDNEFVISETKNAFALIVLALALVLLAVTVILLVIRIVNTIIHIIRADNSALLAYHDVVMGKDKIISNKNDLLVLFISLLALVCYYFLQFKVVDLSQLIVGGLVGGLGGTGGLDTDLNLGAAATCLETFTKVNPLIVVLGGVFVVYIIMVLLISVVNNKMKLNILREKCDELPMSNNDYPM